MSAVQLFSLHEDLMSRLKALNSYVGDHLTAGQADNDRQKDLGTLTDFD